MTTEERLEFLEKDTEERLKSVEQELSRARRRNGFLLAVLGLAVVAWVMTRAFGSRTVTMRPAGPVMEEVRANRFVLVDKKGKNRAELAMSKDKGDRGTYGSKNTGRVSLGLPEPDEEEGPGLFLFDENNVPLAVLCLETAGLPALRLRDENGRIGVEIQHYGSGGGGGPEFTMWDENGWPRVILEANDLQELTLYDANGKCRLDVILDSNGPALRLWDENGKAIWSTP